MASQEEAARAMAELDGKELLGRAVRIKPGVQKSSSTSTSTASPSGSGSGSGFSSGMDRWRRPDQAGQGNSSPIRTQTDSSRRVYVGGLPRVADQEELQSKITAFFDGYQV